MAKRRYSTSDDPTRERILVAALDCISKTSVRELSVRFIAAQAEVNVATVHYYFGTKDVLLTEALNLFFAPLLLQVEAILEGGGQPRARLEKFLLFYVEQFHRNPGIFASVIEAMVASNIRRETAATSAYEEVLLAILGGLRQRILALVGLVSGQADASLLALKTIQVMASVVHPMILSGIPRSLFGVDFDDATQRKKYIGLLVDGLSVRAA